MKRFVWMTVMALALLVQGCQSSKTMDLTAPGLTPSAHCRQLLHQVDQAVIEAGTTDTSVFRVAGFPYLRTSRFLAASAATETRPAAVRQWLARMHQYDLEAREKEILNLDQRQLMPLVNQSRHLTDRQTFVETVCACSSHLFADDVRDPNLAEAVREAIDIPAEYQTWQRVVGLYPLVALPVAYFSAAAFDEFRAWHTLPPEKLPRLGESVLYRPAGHKGRNRLDPETLYKAVPMDALGLPQLSPRDQQRLAAALAPVIVQDTAAAYDHIGRLAWSGGTLTIDYGDPTGYFYVSYGRVNGRPSLQLNYVFWYSHRTGDNAPWIEWGRLDGLTIRISIDQTGRPAMLDIMNNCGCYHFFVPDRTRIRSVRTSLLEPDPLVPAWLPDRFPQERLQLMVSSGWHQVQNISVENKTATRTLPYTLRPYQELEMLPDENGQHRSIFDTNGIARGSSRIEPAIFFSMGIPEVGSMRQRGHHAIKMIGRAYFDDPLLFDTTFDYR